MNTNARSSAPPKAESNSYVLVPFASGWLRLTQEQFDAALIAPTSNIRNTCNTSEDLLEAEAAAVKLGVTARWLEDCARAGIVPHYKLGRFTRFKVSEIAAHFRVDGAPTDSQSDGQRMRLVSQ